MVQIFQRDEVTGERKGLLKYNVNLVRGWKLWNHTDIDSIEHDCLVLLLETNKTKNKIHSMCDLYPSILKICILFVLNPS